MSTDFKLESFIQDDFLVIKTFGYINNEGGEQIMKCFTESFDSEIPNLIINMEASQVVNSIGISYLLEIIEKLMEKEGKLIFTNLSPAIEKTLSIMGLFHYAEQAASVDEAIAGAKG